MVLRFHLLLLLHHLLYVAGGKVHCLEERKVLVLNNGGVTQPHLPQRSRRVEGAAVLEMKHSGYYNNERLDGRSREELRKLLIADKARVTSLQLQIRSNNLGRTQEASLEDRIPLTSGAKLHTLNYIVPMELGGSKMTVIVDTASDLTWVQCMPCNSCHTQQGPVFDPTASPSFSPVPCNSSACNSLQGSSIICAIDQQICNYDLSYGDGSFTHGVLANDRLNLGGTVVYNFVFGCGHENQGLFGATSGLMGLGRAQISLISQTSAQFGGVFSYCLPSREFNSSGSLTFGGNSSTFRNSTPVSYTTMISDTAQTPFYYVNLTSISVGGVVLQANRVASSRVLIDSGTVITRLAPSVYRAVRAEFVRQFASFPPAPGFSILDTCFNLTGYEEVRIPALKLQFEGSVEVSVDASGVLYFVSRDASQVCLALASLAYEGDDGIIGNYQQKNLRVVYDTFGSRLGFAEEDCDYYI